MQKQSERENRDRMEERANMRQKHPSAKTATAETTEERALREKTQQDENEKKETGLCD